MRLPGRNGLVISIPVACAALWLTGAVAHADGLGVPGAQAPAPPAAVGRVTQTARPAASPPAVPAAPAPPAAPALSAAPASTVSKTAQSAQAATSSAASSVSSAASSVSSAASSVSSAASTAAHTASTAPQPPAPKAPTPPSAPPAPPAIPVAPPAPPAVSPPLKAPDPVLPLGAVEDKVASTASTVTRSVPPQIVPIPQPEDVVPTPELHDVVPTPELHDVAPTPELRNVVPTPQLHHIVPTPELREIVPNPDPTELVPISGPDDLVPIAELPEAESAAPTSPAVAEQPAGKAPAYHAQPAAIVPVTADLLAVPDNPGAPLTTLERSSVQVAEADAFSAQTGLIDPRETLGLSGSSPASLQASSRNEASWTALNPSNAATSASSVPPIATSRETLYEPGSQVQPSVSFWPNAVMALRPTIVDRPPALPLGMGSTNLPIGPDAPTSPPMSAAAATPGAPASFTLSNAGAPGTAAPYLVSLTLVAAWRTLWRLASLRPPPICLSSLTPPG